MQNSGNDATGYGRTRRVSVAGEGQGVAKFYGDFLSGRPALRSPAKT